MGIGLRERKKRATRSALHLAAMRLAVDRGVDHVTAEDISAEAGVSARTFFNYFSTKEEAFVADDLDRARQFVEAVREAPDGVPVWPLLRSTAVTVFGANDLPKAEQALKEQLLRSNPTVLAHLLGTVTRLERELVVELARRTATSTTALAPRLMAGGAAAAVRAATDTLLNADAEASPADVFDDAFATLAPAFSPSARASRADG